MKYGLCLGLAAVLSIGGASYGALTNPETFEGYSAATFTAGASEGWDQSHLNGSAAIISSGSHDGSQSLQLVDNDINTNADVRWQNGGGSGTLLYQVDFIVNAGTTDAYNYGRALFDALDSGGNGLGFLAFVNYPAAGGPTAVVDYDGTHYAFLTGTFATGTWYTAQLALDYTNHQLMGRFAPVGQPLPAFTVINAPLATPAAVLQVIGNGTANYDNLSLTVPEPASVGIMLLAGGLLIRRRRGIPSMA